MAHGYCTCLFISNENVKHGSDSFVEMISQTLDRVQEVCTQRGTTMPKHLVIQADNAPGPNKNQFTGVFAAYLVATMHFLTVSLMFFMVGHTHEDIDQFFALVLWLILQLHSYETPEQLAEHLRSRLQDRVAEKGEVLHVMQLNAVHNFKQWLDPLGLQLSGAFKHRDGIEAPHCFSYKLGGHLTQSEQDMVRTEGVAVAEDSVYCCVKTYMRDLHLQQPPVHLMPAARADRVKQRSNVPTQIVPFKDFSKDEVKHVVGLVQQCRNLDLPLAAAALEGLLQPRQVLLPTLKWLATYSLGQMAPWLPRATGNPYFPHLPASSWKMLAKLSE